MATKSYNLRIPDTLFRLGEPVVEDLVVLAISDDISEDHVRETLELRSTLPKKGIREVLRMVTPKAVDEFNGIVDAIRTDVDPEDQIRVRACYKRGLCQVLRFDRE